MEEILKCCRVLDVSPGAPPKAVKKAYRDLVKKWHPDQFGEDPVKRRQAEEKLKDINLAFERIQQSPDLLKTLLRARKPASQPGGQRRQQPGRSTQPRQRQRPARSQHKSPQSPPGTEDPRRGAAVGARQRKSAPAKTSAKNSFQWQTAFVTVLVVGISSIALFFLVPGETPKSASRAATRQSPPQRSQTQLRASLPAVSTIAIQSSAGNPGSPAPGLSELAQILSGAGKPAAGSRPSLRLGLQSPVLSPAQPSPAIESVTTDTDAPPLVDESIQHGLPQSDVAIQPTLETPPDIEGDQPMISESLRTDATAPPPAPQEQSPVPAAIAEANFRRGLNYSSGESVARELEETASSYRLAKEAGVSDAGKSPDLLYAAGKGVVKNDGETARRLKRSASEGNTDAGNTGGLSELANVRSGRRSKLDLASAGYEVAGRKEDPSKLVKVPTAQPSSSNVTSPSQPVADLEKMSPQQQFERGLGFATEFGGQDFVEAAKWYRLAAEAGHREAQKSLGFLYASGTGVKQDDAEAEKWFRMAEQNKAGKSPDESVVPAKREPTKTNTRARTLPSGTKGKSESEYSVSPRTKP